MTIRVLFCSPEPIPTYRADVSVLFGKYLPQFEVYSDIVAESSHVSSTENDWNGGKALYFKIPAGGQFKKRLLSFGHYLKQILKANKNRYQAIIVRDMPILATVGLILARLKGIKFYYWMSFPIPDGQILLAKDRGFSEGLMKFVFPWLCGHSGRFLLYRFVIHRADHTFVQSERMQSDLLSLGAKAERLTPVPMGVDLEALDSMNLPASDDPRLRDREVLIYLGTMDKPRSIEILFEMLALIKEQIPQILLILAGEATEDRQTLFLQNKAEEAGVVDNLLWTGWLPSKEGWRYVKAAKVGLSPFPRSYLLDSASPTKVPEYLALGLPVVCNDNPDQEQIILRSQAGLCIPYNAANFAAAVMQVLALSDQERNAMIQRGQTYIRANRDYREISRSLSATLKRISG